MKSFSKKYRKLNLHNVSTAQLQGLFVYNKRDPKAAIDMVETLRDPNTVF